MRLDARDQFLNERIAPEEEFPVFGAEGKQTEKWRTRIIGRRILSEADGAEGNIRHFHAHQLHAIHPVFALGFQRRAERVLIRAESGAQFPGNG